MPDDLSNTGKRDDERVNVNQPHEVQYWCGKWNVSEEQLRKAVQEVGVMVKDVQRKLGK